jgi:hypothetical protein
MKAVIYLIIGILALLTVTTSTASEKQVVGWVERVRIFPGGFVLPAKIDTGADNSSLNVEGFTVFDRNNEDWVRFTVVDSNGKEHELERRLVRVAKIKRHSGPRQERPVVLLGICLGKHYRETEVNLVDRSKFKFPLLIGRSFTADAVVVDPAATYNAEPECPGAPVE